MNKQHEYAEVIKAWAEGRTTQYRHRRTNGEWVDMHPSEFDFRVGAEYRIKPDPPKYPQTRMTRDEARTIANTAPLRECPHIAVANAAIARAIEDGQMVPTEKVPGARLVFDAELAQLVPASVLWKVARAVFAECDSRMIDMYNDQALQSIDLAAIIASVREGK